MAKEPTLCTPGSSSNWNRAIKNTRSRLCIHGARSSNFRKQFSRDIQNGKQFLVPGLRVQIEQHRPRGVAGTGDMQRAGGEIPSQPGINSSKSQLATIRALPSARHVIQKPADFAAGKISVDDQAGLAFDQIRWLLDHVS